MNSIHHPDLHMRFLATEEFQRNGNKREETWPRACWGSANAWIVLVGPSPGAPKDANKPGLGLRLPRKNERDK